MHPIPGPAVEMLKARGHDVVVGPKDGPYDGDELAKLVKDADAVLTLHYDDVSEKFFQAAGPQLSIVANFGVGYEHIDLEAAKKYAPQSRTASFRSPSCAAAPSSSTSGRAGASPAATKRRS